MDAGADQRSRFDDDGAVQSTVSVVGEPPKGHAALLHLATADDTATAGTTMRPFRILTDGAAGFLPPNP